MPGYLLERLLNYPNFFLFQSTITIEFTQTHFKIKMSLGRAQNIFMPKNINSIAINITLEGAEKIKTEKNDNKTL